MTAFETVLFQIPDVKVIDKNIGHQHYSALNLSHSNKNLDGISFENASEFDLYIQRFLKAKKAKVAFGGYNENRNIYKRSTIFNNSEGPERNIHIGLDLWIKAGTPVLAALDGKVHSYDFNAGLGNYGPTIILEHQFPNASFYTLYGHLSLQSISELEIGTTFKKGQQLGTLGDASVNGDYAPHLHFQIIRNIGDCFGDYPGVCSDDDLHYYMDNCPDPNLLLKIR